MSYTITEYDDANCAALRRVDLDQLGESLLEVLTNVDPLDPTCCTTKEALLASVRSRLQQLENGLHEIVCEEASIDPTVFESVNARPDNVAFNAQAIVQALQNRTIMNLFIGTYAPKNYLGGLQDLSNVSMASATFGYSVMYDRAKSPPAFVNAYPLVLDIKQDCSHTVLDTDLAAVLEIIADLRLEGLKNLFPGLRVTLFVLGEANRLFFQSDWTSLPALYTAREDIRLELPENVVGVASMPHPQAWSKDYVGQAVRKLMQQKTGGGLPGWGRYERGKAAGFYRGQQRLYRFDVAVLAMWCAARHALDLGLKVQLAQDAVDARTGQLAAVDEMPAAFYYVTSTEFVTTEGDLYGQACKAGGKAGLRAPIVNTELPSHAVQEELVKSGLDRESAAMKARQKAGGQAGGKAGCRLAVPVSDEERACCRAMMMAVAGFLGTATPRPVGYAVLVRLPLWKQLKGTRDSMTFCLASLKAGGIIRNLRANDLARNAAHWGPHSQHAAENILSSQVSQAHAELAASKKQHPRKGVVELQEAGDAEVASEAQLQTAAADIAEVARVMAAAMRRDMDATQQQQQQQQQQERSAAQRSAAQRAAQAPQQPQEQPTPLPSQAVAAPASKQRAAGPAADAAGGPTASEAEQLGEAQAAAAAAIAGAASAAGNKRRRSGSPPAEQPGQQQQQQQQQSPSPECATPANLSDVELAACSVVPPAKRTRRAPAWMRDNVVGEEIDTAMAVSGGGAGWQ